MLLASFYLLGLSCEAKHHLKKERTFLNEAVKKNGDKLTMQKKEYGGEMRNISDPKEFLLEHDKRDGDQWARVSIGIVVENYSRYKLTDPRTSGQANCGKNNEVLNLKACCKGVHKIRGAPIGQKSSQN